MTHVTYLTNSALYVFTAILDVFSKAFWAVMDVMIEARQQEINYDIAKRLWMTEYRNESFDMVHKAVRENNLESLGK
jgi:DNA polymerase IIIc chi subunit